jgi:hypothetical protein
MNRLPHAPVTRRSPNEQPTAPCRRRRLVPLALAALGFAAPVAAQWSRVAAIPATNVFCVVVQEGVIVAGAETAVFVSTDHGTTWRRSAPLAPAVTSIQAVRMNQGRLFAGTFGQGVFVSDDLGVTWNAFNQGLTGGLFNSQLFISSFEVAGCNLLAGTFGAGVYARSLGGGGWAPFGAVFEPEQASNINTLLLGGTRLVAAGGSNGTVFRRDPGEADWTPSALGPHGALPGIQTHSLFWTGSRWLAGTSSGVFLSASGQEPWSLWSPGVVSLRSSAFAMPGRNLLAAFDLPTEALIASSPDEGVSWHFFEHQPGVFVFALAADGAELYAARADGLWQTQSDVEAFGTGCPGAGGIAPQLGSDGPLVLGSNPHLQLTRALPNATALFALGLTPSGLPGDCVPLIDPAATLLAPVDTTGVASMNLRVPNVVALVGLELFGQGAVLDPAGGFFGLASLSQGLRLVVGP